MKLKISLVLCMLVLISSVVSFTSCPSDAEFEETIKSAIVNYFNNPSEENLNVLKDLVEFYSTHDLSTADCSEEGKNSGVEIQEIYDNTEKMPAVIKEEIKGVIDMILAVDGANVYNTILLVDDEPSTYLGVGGDYELKVLDSVGNVLWSQNFKLSYMYNESLSDSVFDVLGYKIPYDSRMFEVKLYKKGDNIFSKQLSFCNNNSICDYDSENLYSCPSDCAEPGLKGPITGAVTGAASASGSSGIAYRKARWYWKATFDYFINIQYSDDKVNWHNILPSCSHVRFREDMEKQKYEWADVGAHKYWALYICGTGGTPPFQIWEMDWFTHDGTNYVENNPTASEISFEGPYTSFNPANLIDNNLYTLGLQRNQPGTSTARMIISKGGLIEPKPMIITNIVKGFSCGSESEGLKNYWESETGNKFELVCEHIPEAAPEFHLKYIQPSENKLVGRCPWCAGRNYGQIQTSGDSDADGKFDSFTNSFWLSMEPDPDECCYKILGICLQRCIDICEDQGEQSFTDWKEYSFNAQTKILRIEHYKSKDGPGGPLLDILVNTAIDEDPLIFDPPAGSPPMIAYPYELCDNDRDGDCDAYDIQLITLAIGQCKSGNNYNTLADADHDGCVTESDREQLFPKLDCEITSDGICDGVTVFKIQNLDNGHAQLQGSYPYSVCCGGVSGLGTENTGTAVLGFAEQDNSHVQKNSVGTYLYKAYLSAPSGITCDYIEGRGDGYTVCEGVDFDTCLASIQNDDNSHIGNCDAYNQKICCKVGGEEGF